MRGEKGRLFCNVNIFSRIASAAAAVNGGSGLKWSAKNVEWVPDRGPGCSCLFCPVPRLLMAYCVLSGSGIPARSQEVCNRSWHKPGIWASGTGPRRRSPGGGVIWMPSKMKQGVPKKFSYICRVTQELFGSWIPDNERLQVFRAEGASNSAFHLDPPDQTTVKLSLRFGFVRGP